MATLNASWLHLSATNQSGTGSATVVFTFDANTGTSRAGTLTIAGQTLTVSQLGATYALRETELLEQNNAGSDNVSLIVTPSTANWTASADASWLHLTAANQSGTGSTNVAFAFDANPGATRTGTLTIAGLTLTVIQGSLNFSLGTPALVEGPAAGSDSVVLAANPNSSSWTATANDNWLHLSPGNQSGTGSTNVVFSFDANLEGTRTGTLLNRRSDSCGHAGRRGLCSCATIGNRGKRVPDF